MNPEPYSKDPVTDYKRKARMTKAVPYHWEMNSGFGNRLIECFGKEELSLMSSKNNHCNVFEADAKSPGLSDGT